MEGKGKAVFILGLLLFSVLPLAAQAEESGGIEAAAHTMAFQPANPVLGGSVDIDVTLYNSQQSDAFNVEVAVYKENIAQNNRLIFDTVTIYAQSSYTVSTTWSGLTEGPHKVCLLYTSPSPRD